MSPRKYSVASTRSSATCGPCVQGVILYMLVSGVPPFWGRSDKQIRNRILQGDYSFPRRQFQHVSPLAMDLIRHLLQVDTEKRYTASDALAHPWIRQVTKDCVLPEKSLGNLVSNFRLFSSFSVMRKLMLEVIACMLTTEKISELRAVFEKMDTDQSGTLSLDEVRVSLQSFPGIDDDEIERLFSALDHGEREIHYSKFIAATMWKRIHLDEDRLHHVFDLLDIEQQGFLTADSIQNVVGRDYSPEEVASMVNECDITGDGRVDYNEFEKLWQSHQLQVHEMSLGPLVSVQMPSQCPDLQIAMSRRGSAEMAMELWGSSSFVPWDTPADRWISVPTRSSEPLSPPPSSPPPVHVVEQFQRRITFNAGRRRRKRGTIQIANSY